MRRWRGFLNRRFRAKPARGAAARFVVPMILLPILLITCFFYASIESLLMQYMEAEGGFLINQIAASSDLAIRLIEAEIRRMGSQSSFEDFIYFPNGAYYESLLMKDAAAGDYSKNYEYIMLKKNLLYNMSATRDASEYIRAISLFDAQKEIVLSDVKLQSPIEDCPDYELLRALPTTYDFERCLQRYERASDGEELTLKLAYSIGKSKLLVDVDLSGLLARVTSDIVRERSVTLALLDGGGQARWSSGPASSEDADGLLSRAANAGEALRRWTDDGRYLAIAVPMASLEGTFAGVYDREALIGRLSGVFNALILLLGGMLAYLALSLVVTSRFFAAQLQKIRSHLGGANARHGAAYYTADIHREIDSILRSRDEIESQLNVALPLQRQRFLLTCLTGDALSESSFDYARRFGMDFDGLYLILLYTDHVWAIEGSVYSELEGILERLLGKKRRYAMTPLSSNQTAVLIEMAESCPPEICKIAASVTDALESVTGLLFFASVSHWVKSFDQAHLACREAKKSINLRDLAALEQVTCAGSLNARKADALRYPEEKRLLLCECVRGGDTEGALRMFDSLYEEMRRGTVHMTLGDVRGALVWVYGAVQPLLARSDEQSPSVQTLMDMLGRSDANGLVVEFRQFLCDVTEKARTHISDNNAQYMEEINRAIERIPLAELSLESAAGALYVSASHLSRSFQQRTGMRFIDYLTERRLNQAELLLRSSEMRIQEIAVEVGWGKASYFSNQFKERYGLTPSEFRKKAAQSAKARNE